MIVNFTLGVETRVPYSSGSTKNFEYLDTSIPYGDSDYFHTLVEAMVGAGGIQNVSIRGSPYDFRFAPSSAYSGSWLQKITHLVEETYALNNNSSVALLRLKDYTTPDFSICTIQSRLFNSDNSTPQ